MAPSRVLSGDWDVVSPSSGGDGGSSFAAGGGLQGGSSAKPGELGGEVADKIFALLDKSGQKNFGLHIDNSDGFYLYVNGVHLGDTAAQRYNRSVPMASALRRGDFVVAVNGLPANADHMSQFIIDESNVELEVVRPEVLRIKIKKLGGPLGVEFLALEGCHSALIERIGSGALKNWNLAHPGREVMPGDRVISVNGKEGTGEQLMDMMAGLPSFELMLHRCPENIHEI